MSESQDYSLGELSFPVEYLLSYSVCKGLATYSFIWREFPLF